MSRQERESIQRKYKKDFGEDLFEGLDEPIGQYDEKDLETTGFWSSVIATA